MKSVDFHPQRAARRRETLAKVICLNGVGNDDQDRRERFTQQESVNLLDDELGLAVTRRGKEQARHTLLIHLTKDFLHDLLTEAEAVFTK